MTLEGVVVNKHRPKYNFTPRDLTHVLLTLWNTYSCLSIFYNGIDTLKLYTTHPTRPQVPGGHPHYHMTQIKGYNMTSDRETFQKGATAFRNLRVLAETRRNSFIEEANRAARHAPTSSPSTTLTEGRESRSVLNEGHSDTSTDELAAEELTAKRHRYGGSRGQRLNTPKVAPRPVLLLDTQLLGRLKSLGGASSHRKK